MLRFRQAVIAARDLGAAVAELRGALPLGDPYADYFGLRNAVTPLGDRFVAVVSPARDDTAAGRFLDRPVPPESCRCATPRRRTATRAPRA